MTVHTINQVMVYKMLSWARSQILEWTMEPTTTRLIEMNHVLIRIRYTANHR
jgi:hypothetical protein